MFWVCGRDKAGWLTHVDGLIRGEFTIYVCSLDIYLMEFHVIVSSEGKDCVDGAEAGHRCKGIKVVDSWDLKESLCDKVGFLTYTTMPDASCFTL